MGEGRALFFVLDSLSLFKTEILVMLRGKISFHFDFPTPCNPGTHELEQVLKYKIHCNLSIFVVYKHGKYWNKMATRQSIIIDRCESELEKHYTRFQFT